MNCCGRMFFLTSSQPDMWGEAVTSEVLKKLALQPKKIVLNLIYLCEGSSRFRRQLSPVQDGDDTGPQFFLPCLPFSSTPITTPVDSSLGAVALMTWCLWSQNLPAAKCDSRQESAEWGRGEYTVVEVNPVEVCVCVEGGTINITNRIIVGGETAVGHSTTPQKLDCDVILCACDTRRATTGAPLTVADVGLRSITCRPPPPRFTCP